MSRNKFVQQKPTAILVDGSFFLKRYRRCVKNSDNHTPKEVAKKMYTILLKHVEDENLYRILYYDCPPIAKRAHNPITGKCIDFTKTEIAQFRTELHNELKKLRKVALRFGYLKEQSGWMIHSNKMKEILKKKIFIDDLSEDDVYYNIKQKFVSAWISHP